MDESEDFEMINKIEDTSELNIYGKKDKINECGKIEEGIQYYKDEEGNMKKEEEKEIKGKGVIFKNEEEKQISIKQITNFTKNKKLKELSDRQINDIFSEKKEEKEKLTKEEKLLFFSKKINTSSSEIKKKINLNIALTNTDKKCSYESKIYDNNNKNISKTNIKNKNENINLKENLTLSFEFTKVEMLTIIIIKHFSFSKKIEIIKKISLQDILLKNKYGIYEEILDDLGHKESIKITFDSSKDNKKNKEIIALKFNTDKNFDNTNDIFYTIQKGENIIYKSPICNSSNIKTSDKLKISDLEPEFKLSFYNKDFYEKQIKLGTKELKQGVTKDIKFPLANNLKINISGEKIDDNYFIDLFKQGLNINLSIAIDFTASNIEPTNKRSLHYIKNGNINNYEKAIRENIEIISKYNKEDKYDIYGFGAQIKGEFKNIFNLNGKDDPSITGIENIISEYKNFVNDKNNVFSGQTFFSPLIKEIKEKLERHKRNYHDYHILLIISDGKIDDIKETIDSIIEASFYPVSFIIIGIGDDVTLDMRKLNGENGKLISSKGEVLNKDIVQYVHFNYYANDLNKLTKEVLKYIPDQISKYY